MHVYSLGLVLYAAADFNAPTKHPDLPPDLEQLLSRMASEAAPERPEYVLRGIS